MLTHQQTQILEDAWSILDKLRGCASFNESHDLTIGDACSVLSDLLDYVYAKDRAERNQPPMQVVLVNLESFQNL